MFAEYATLDATALADLVRAGEVSAAELVDAALARIERHNPRLGAVVRTMAEQARAAAAADLPDGPFRGVPMLLKDLIATTAGDPYHAGTRFLREAGYRAPHDSALARRLRAAGFVICGKTATPELGILPTTEPTGSPPARNPWDLERTTGGSSGGSAAAVAAGLVPVAHGGDGGGSIRIPASACGLVGLKPTRGRTTLGPDVGETAAGLVVEGVLTRSVRDSAGVLDAVHGPAPGDPYAAAPPARPYREEVGADPGRLKIGFATTFPAPGGVVTPAHADCIEAVRQTAALLETLGHHVEEALPEALLDPAYVPNFMSVWAAGVAYELAHWEQVLGRPIKASEVEPLTWALAEMGRATHAGGYLLALAWLRANSRGVATFWSERGFDLWLTPTLAEPPVKLGELASTPAQPMALHPILRAASFVPHTPPFNVTGQPAISLPMHRTATGLPIGIQLVAAYGREDVLFRVAAQLEQARPWPLLAPGWD